MTSETFVIDPTYYGFPDVGHGGYVSGILAGEAMPVAEITLRATPPLGVPLEIARDGDRVTLTGDDGLIASVRAVSFDLELPEPPTPEEAEEASGRCIAHERPFCPTCMVCGPARAPGEGLRILPGPVDGRALVAGPWTPDSFSLGEDNHVRVEFLWAALDCPGWYALTAGEELRPMVTGRITGQVVRRPAADEKLVVIGWPIVARGRKMVSGTAVFSASHGACAFARSVWFDAV